MALIETTQRIRDEFEASCLELFRGLNCNVTRLDRATASFADAPLSYIDAGNDDVEIVISLHIPMAVLSMSYPKFETTNILAVTDKNLEDWISELANQLMGRFKNKMLSNGCRLKIGLPAMTFDRSELDEPTASHEPYFCFFDLDKEQFECSIFIQVFNENLTLTSQAPEPDAPAEGELELF